MRTILFFISVTFGLAVSVGNAQEDVSTISLPIRIHLKAVEDRINVELPQRLANINEPGKLCIPAQWLKTKGIPKCRVRGLKVYCEDRWIKTRITPDIHCDVKGWVNRNGNVGLSGSGQTLQVSVPIASSVSAKAAGIQETADAEATIFAAVTPDITPKWEVSAVVEPDMRWDKRPTLKLFDLIEISIGSAVEPKLREKMGEFAAKIPQLLSELNIRGKVEEAWNKIQSPIQIAQSPAAYLIFQPSSVGFSGISIDNDILNASVSIAGTTKVVVGNIPEVALVPLTPLQKIAPGDGAFRFKVPTFVTYEEIERTAESRFPDGFDTELKGEKLQGRLALNNLKVGRMPDGRLRLSIDVDYDNRSDFLRWIDVFDWFDISGNIVFSAVPKIDAENDLLFVEGLELDGTTNNTLADALIGVSQLPILQDFLSDSVKYDYSGDLQKGIAAANKAMNIQLEDEIRVLGTVTAADIDAISVLESGLSLSATAAGTVSLDVGL